MTRALSLNLLAAGLLSLATLVLAPAPAHACERVYPQANGDDRTRHVRLSAGWTDAKILQNLKLNLDRADVKGTESSGVVSIGYTYFHKTVVITRSASKGVEVQLLEKDREKLVWQLGLC
ncbi:hypothetical protein RCH14_000753 [Massilia sp. MP_M2]|uniref:hypothetical protein n=1 Tax=Massilia sp. MP_M2 TaxID=3071713 RepID=UPI00319E57F9